MFKILTAGPGDEEQSYLCREQVHMAPVAVIEFVWISDSAYWFAQKNKMLQAMVCPVFILHIE